MNKGERFPVMVSIFPRNRQNFDVPMGWVLNHENQCVKNHGQTALRLKERGGLSPKELYAVLHDMRWDDVKFSESECLAIIKNMVLTCTHPEANAFYKYLEKLSSIAQNSSDSNFVTLQKARSDILNSYTFGYLSDVEKRNLYNTATIIMNKMREKLNEQKGVSDGPKVSQDDPA